jgi:hypothetical protein
LVLVSVLLSGCVKPCVDRSVSDCTNGGGCSVLSARRVDAQAECLNNSRDVGCQADDLACDDVITHAQDPKGVVWLFNDSCIPLGWKTDVKTAARSDWPDCKK